MGERNNGYASCELRRGFRGRGGNPTNVSRGTRREEYEETGGCGICKVFGCDLGDRDCGRSTDGGGRGNTCCGNDNRNCNRNRNNGEGCGCVCRQGSDRANRNTCGERECHALMNKLQQLDFSIQETVLYLDAYPDCCAALDYYHQLLDERAHVAEEYEKSCGPLSKRGCMDRSSWDWIKAPWPWYTDFPGNGTNCKQG